ncbi:MAG: hypothetical protein ABI837_06030 [Acidobacteriota bacterium]
MKTTMISTLALLASLTAFPQEPPLRGRLCFVDPGQLRCSAVAGAAITGEAAKVRRHLVWTGDDAKRVEL